VYGKIINEKPDFDYYVVVFAPVSVSITSGVILPIPVSGMRINLGDEVVQGSPFGLPLNDVKNKIL
jgi:DNA-directed RNA polymerase subunit E'/Rpb7